MISSAYVVCRDRPSSRSPFTRGFIGAPDPRRRRRDRDRGLRLHQLPAVHQRDRDRYVRAQAQIDLARDIIVSSCRRSRNGSATSSFSAGRTLAATSAATSWTSSYRTTVARYVADVSGHGVGSGVVIGMFKSALRMRARAGGPSPATRRHHAGSMPLKQPDSSTTVACVRGGCGNEVECAVAGHLPIRRVRNGDGEEVMSPQIPVGMFDGTTFSSLWPSACPVICSCR